MTIARIALTMAVLLVAATSGDAQSIARKANKAPSKPGATFKECRNCPEMVVIPPGSFMIGSPPDEPERRDNEPQKRITFARAYAIGKTEVTWDQWEACVRDRWCDGLGIEQALKTNEDGTPNKAFVDWGRGTRPVVGPSWFDAQTFVGWLNWKTGEDDAYRLPSEAEWEYAARGGTTTAYPWGAKLDHNYGNFGGPGPGLGGKADGRDRWVDQTAPVASFPANAFGLHDMHGNVLEWCEDLYDADYYRKSPEKDPPGPQQSSEVTPARVLRGGSWYSPPEYCRSAYRRANPPDVRLNIIGFRVALDL